MSRTMLSMLLLFLLSLVIHCKDTFEFNDCWCRNTTHLAYHRYYRLEAQHVEGTPADISEWCLEHTIDGRGACLDQHTQEYHICASYPAIHNTTARNDFCWYNHGNIRRLEKTAWFVKGYPNAISAYSLDADLPQHWPQSSNDIRLKLTTRQLGMVSIVSSISSMRRSAT